jgi:hypothetical protein
VCGVLEEEDKSNKKRGERQSGKATWGATTRGDSLVIKPLQTNSGCRGLFSLSWALNCRKDLLLSPRFSFSFCFLNFF